MKTEELRQQIVIETPTTTRDTAGGAILSWATFATVRASKKNQYSREFYAAQKNNAEITDLFVIRFRTGLNDRMRVSYNGKIYDILGANDPDGRRREIYLLCREVT
jgi:SPP1 family predicted phage head-tail adaptor